jgi:hypothetical protein
MLWDIGDALVVEVVGEAALAASTHGARAAIKVASAVKA